jgi:hypothetical protein
MNLHNRWLTAALLSIGVVSCQKEAIITSATSPATTKTTSDLGIGPAPAMLWWSNGPAIPYTDDIAGDVPRNNSSPVGFAINGKGYVCGSVLTTGWNTGDYIHDLWEFDPATQRLLAIQSGQGHLGETTEYPWRSPHRSGGICDQP